MRLRGASLPPSGEASPRATQGASGAAAASPAPEAPLLAGGERPPEGGTGARASVAAAAAEWASSFVVWALERHLRGVEQLLPAVAAGLPVDRRARALWAFGQLKAAVSGDVAAEPHP